jgi:hypothetical protein
MKVLDFTHAAHLQSWPADLSSPRPATDAVACERLDRRPIAARLFPTFITVASFAWSVITASFALISAFLGPIEFSIVDGEFCPDCRDVHPKGECRRALVGDCDVCIMTVELDSAGNCANAGTKYRNHRIRNRRPKPRRPLREVMPATTNPRIDQKKKAPLPLT